MQLMKKYFSPYLEKLEKQDKNTRVALIVAAFGILFFLSLAVTLPFRDTLFAGLFPKDPSSAQEKDAVVCAVLPDTPIDKPDRNRAKDITLQAEQLDEQLADEAYDYRRVSVKEKNNRKKRIKDLAEKRKRLLIETMKQNPDAAYDMVQSDTDEDLTAATKDCAATPATTEGELVIWHTDYVDETSNNQYFVQTGTQVTAEIHPAGNINKRLLSGMKVKVKGHKLDKHLVFNGNDPSSLEILENAVETNTQGSAKNPLVPKAHAAIPASLGDQKTIVIMWHGNGQPFPVSRETIRNAIFVDANNFFKENSYGQTSFSGEVYGPYILENKSAVCASSDTITPGFDGEYDAMLAANAEGVDFTKYSRLVFVGYPTCPLNTGSSSWGQYSYPTPDGTVKMSVAKVKAGLTKFTAYSHELGHSLGTMHAGSYNCGSVALVPVTQRCSVTEYGDIYDRMGSGHRHLNAVHKDIIGWFRSGEKQIVTTSGDYTLIPIATASSGLKALKIPRVPNASGNDGYLTVEYRQPIGFDAGYKPPNTLYSGALLHLADFSRSLNGYSDSWVLDATPPFDLQTPTIPLNGSFTDPQTGTKITVTGLTPSALTVRVDYKGPPPLPDQPKLTITSPTDGSTVSPKSQVTITASAPSGTSKVEFYVKGVLKCTANAAPYSCTWKVPKRKGKKYAISAKAYDANNNVIASTQISVRTK